MMQQPNVSQGALDTPIDGSEPSFWMPVQAAEGVKDVDFAFNFILAICTFFFVLIVGLGILFVIKYRKRPGYVPKPSPHHSLKLEVTWSVIPIILCVFMFWFGFTGYMHGRTMPEDANQINVVAQKWSWNFQYANGGEDTILHLPVGEPTVVTMRSKDVLHSFFIPAFRSKLDVVPGRYSKLWFTPTIEGEYQLFCTEYCGTGHSNMAARVKVYPREEYDEVVKELVIKVDPDKTPVENGRIRFEKLGCLGCHRVDGTRLVGPPLNEVFGANREFQDGSSTTADENYIRQSILDPNSQVVKDYAPAMQSYQGIIEDEEIDVIIAYLKHLAEQN